MAKLPGNPLTFVPTGASDAVDGTNSFPGAMKALTNLIPDPSTRGLWAPRPASILEATSTVPDPGVQSAMLVVGDVMYGMIPSSRNSGHDEPIAYNLATDTWLTVDNIRNDNTPVSQPSSGEWTPPVMAQVGTRIIVTHPGFPGGTTKFGWFDLSDGNFTFNGNTSTIVGGETFVTGLFSLFLQPGDLVSGTNIQPNTEVIATYSGMSAYKSQCDIVDGSTVVAVSEMTGWLQNTLVFGDGIPAGTYAVAVAGGVFGPGTAYLSQPATKTITTDLISVHPGTAGITIDLTTTAGSTAATAGYPVGNLAIYYAAGQILTNVANLDPGTIITSADAAGNVTLSIPAIGTNTFRPEVQGTVLELSKPTTGDVEQTTITVIGGTTARPLWGAGDTLGNPLPSIPVGVAQFNGRAYYACGLNGVAFSDPLQPCRRTNANQALTTNDGLPVTAVAPLLLNAPITGGIVQALIAFQGANQMRQITGDPVTSNLAMNLLPVATGTLAPLSIVPAEKGLAFISPDGLRFIDFAGNVSTPVGDFGQGIVVPFHEAVVPSRICGAAVSSVLRFTVQNGAVDGDPFQEWWYDLSLQKWSGPHTFPAALIQRWRNQCLLAAVGISGKLWSSTVVPSLADTYVENEQTMSCIAQTVLLPDNQQLGMNKMVEANLACAGSLQINYQVFDEYGNPLDYVGIPIPSDGSGAFRQRPVYFHWPVEFKQMSVMVVAQATLELRLGSHYWRWQVLPYNIEPVIPPFDYASL